jgi:hypothetical protein
MPPCSSVPNSAPKRSADVHQYRCHLRGARCRTTALPLQRDEQTFLACALWPVSALVHVGRADEARRIMDALTVAASPLGLVSEMVASRAHRPGNEQGFKPPGGDASRLRLPAWSRAAELAIENRPHHTEGGHQDASATAASANARRPIAACCRVVAGRPSMIRRRVSTRRAFSVLTARRPAAVSRRST